MSHNLVDASNNSDNAALRNNRKRSAYAREIAAINLCPRFVDRLRALALNVRNDYLLSASPVPEPKLVELSEAFSEQSDMMHIGPFISVYEQQSSIEDDFCIENFFGADEATRHRGPNKAFINVGTSIFQCEVSLLQGGALVELLHTALPDSTSQALRSPVCTINPTGLELAVRSFDIAQGHALIVPTSTTLFRFRSRAELQVLHGYLRAA
jgi:hypothetical protein